MSFWDIHKLKIWLYEHKVGYKNTSCCAAVLQPEVLIVINYTVN